MGVFRAIATTAAGVFLLTVSGCSPSEPSSSRSSHSTMPTTPTATATAVTSSPVQRAQAEVLTLVPTYVRMIDDLYLDPSRPLDDIYQVAVAPEATVDATAIGNFRGQGYRQIGRSQLVTATAKIVDLPKTSSASPSSALPTVTVTACVDVSQVDALNASGQSVVPPGRPRYLLEQLTVTNLHYPDAASWRVSEAPNMQAQSCAE